MNDTSEREEFTDQQLRKALKQVGVDAKRIAFAKRRPVFVLRHNQLVAVHRDGRVETVTLAKGVDLIGGQN